MPNRSGQRRTTSRVLVPMDPVEPRSVRRVTRTPIITFHLILWVNDPETVSCHLNLSTA